MSWRRRRWSETSPRPKAAKLSEESLQRLHGRAEAFVHESIILCELVRTVQLSRGRLYLWREPEDLMARMTPLGPRSLLLESPYRNSWVEHKRGQLTTLLKAVEGDCKGSFHGLGSLVAGVASVQVRLYRDLKIPIRILAEPAYWYRKHRKPVLVEVNDDVDRVLVHFVAQGVSGTFHGTCLYACREGEWGCYTVRPNASESIAEAEAWLEKRHWRDWG